MKEIWKDIPGYGGAYQASNHGRIRSFKNGRHGLRKEGRLMSRCRAGNGYYYVRVSENKVDKGKKVSRLVAKTFLLNPENKPCVNHIDGVKTNDYASNLEWCTYSENGKHAFSTGLSQISEDQRNALSKSYRGEGASTSKLTDDDVIEIRALWPLGCFSQKEIAHAYGVNQTTIHCLLTLKTWSHL